MWYELHYLGAFTKMEYMGRDGNNVMSETRFLSSLLFSIYVDEKNY